MRLVLFGETTPAVEVLSQEDVRGAVLKLASGHEVEPPQVAAETGLIVTGDDGRPVLGSMFVRPVDDPDGHMDRAAERAADIIAASAGDLADALHVDRPDLEWSSAGLLVVGGALLDLMVGEKLCLSGAVGDLDTVTKLWVLPTAEVAVGMRCLHDDDRRVGAAVMWTADRPAPDIAPLPDLAELVTPAAEPGALALLRLRHLGWLSGNDHRFVTVDAGSSLGDALSRVAERVATDAYSDAFAALSPHDTGHPRLMASRLIFERVLARLMRRGVIDPAGDLRRMVWTGPAWRLMTLEAGSQ